MMKTLRELGGLSIIHPMWNEEKRFELQLENWRTWDEEIRDLVDITIVDDHSDPPVSSYVGLNRQKVIEDLDLEISIYRILDDLKWNTPGALNLGVTVAPKPWVLFMDSDCMFDSDNVRKLLNLVPNPRMVHKFKRWRIEKDKDYEFRPLTCTMLMHKKRFWRIRFDEDFSGSHSGGYGFFDNNFDHRGGSSRRVLVNDIYATEYMHDIVGRVERDHQSHHNINKKLMYEKEKGNIPYNNQILNFAWELDYEHSRNEI
jgi:hypothetical protein